MQYDARLCVVVGAPASFRGEIDSLAFGCFRGAQRARQGATESVKRNAVDVLTYVDPQHSSLLAEKRTQVCG